MNDSSTSPMISVIVPIYNIEQYLDDCVNCILRQNVESLEVILVDDGSTDSSGKMADRYAEKYPFFKVVHKANAGLGMARNSGLEIAGGKWVLFLDADDMLADRAIPAILEVAESMSDIDEVRFTSKRFNATETPDTSLPDLSGKPVISPADSITKVHPILKSMVPAWNGTRFEAPGTQNVCSLYRRSVIETYGLLFRSERSLISEDIVFNIDFARACRRIAYTPWPLQLYRITPGSLTTALRPDRIERSAVFCDFVERYLDSLGEPDASVIAMGAMLGFLRTQARHIFSSSLPTSEKRRLFGEMAAHPYVRRISREFPMSELPLLPRIAFRTQAANRYHLSRLLTSLRDLLPHG